MVDKTLTLKRIFMSSGRTGLQDRPPSFVMNRHRPAEAGQLRHSEEVVSKGAWKFTKREVARMLRAARAGGMLDPELIFRPDGSILVTNHHNDDQRQLEEGSALDQWISKHAH